MTYPLISIILSTYNGNKFISESIDSVINQTYDNFEFIIINDNSSDNVEDIILNYQQNDSRIIYIKNSNNLGLTKSLNKGLEITKGKYIARIDDDDIWDKNKLEKQVNFMQKNEDYGLCGTSTIIIDKNGEIRKKVKMKTSNDDIKRSFLKSNQFTHSSVMIRKESLEKVGGKYNIQYNGAEDYELWLRIGKKYKLYNLEDYLVQYRWLESSISRKKWLHQEILSLKLSWYYRSIYNKFYISCFLRLIYLIIPKKIKELINN